MRENCSKNLLSLTKLEKNIDPNLGFKLNYFFFFGEFNKIFILQLKTEFEKVILNTKESLSNNGESAFFAKDIEKSAEVGYRGN